MRIAVPVSLLLLSAVVSSGWTGCGADPIVEKPNTGDEKLASITLTVNDASLRVNETARLSAEGKGTTGSWMALDAVTFETSDATVAAVDTEGVVTAKGTGAVTLTARSGGKSGTVDLKVEGGAVHSGVIGANETWREKDNPHYVTGTVLVEGSNTPVLTLDPGVQVRFARSTTLYVGQNGPGTLEAAGTEQKHITFAPDTTAPSAGFWDAIRFQEQSGVDSELRFADLSYCGAETAFRKPCVLIYGNDAGGGAQPVLVDVAVGHSAGTGVSAVNDGAFGEGSARVSVTDGGDVAFNIDANQAGTLPEGGTLARNAPDAVLVNGGVVSITQTWPNLGVPYILTDRAINIEGVNEPVLTLVPGTVVRMGKDSVIDVGANGPGGLVAEGTAEAPVVFTSHQAVGSKGYWEGLVFWGDALTTSRLSHVTVEFGGASGGTLWGNIVVKRDIGAFITDTTVRSSAGCGLVRRNDFGDFATDFTAAEHDITFESNTNGTQCGPN